MAIFTTVSLSEAKDFLNDYDLGEVLTLTPITSGIENTNYKLATSKGMFVLTLFEARTPKSALPFVFNLLLHLHKNNLPVAMPATNKNGDIISVLNNRPASIVEFLEGASVTKPQAEHCFSVGKCLAQIHLASEGFDGLRDNPFGLSKFTDFAKNITGNLDDIESGLAALVENELGFLNIAAPNNLPKGIVHADLFTDNVLFLERDNSPQISGIIDFYYASIDSYAYDFAVTLNCWAGLADGSLGLEKSRAFSDGYQSKRALNTQESQAMNWLFRMASLRFLLSRANDWFLPVDKTVVAKKDPLEYVKKLRFHQKLQSYEEFGIVNE